MTILPNPSTQTEAQLLSRFGGPQSEQLLMRDLVHTMFGLGGVNAAVDVTFAPAGTIGATNVQAAIEEVASEAATAAAARGDVFGPASATDNAIPLFDGTTGKLLSDSLFKTVNGTLTWETTLSPAYPAVIDIYGANFCWMGLSQYSANASGPQIWLTKGRGDFFTPAAVVANDQIGEINFGGTVLAPSSGWEYGITIRGFVTEATPTGSAFGSRLVTLITATGAGSPTEIMRLEHATGLSMFGANPVIDQNRVFRLRGYATGSLPAASAAAGMLAYDTTLDSSVFSTGSAWVSPLARATHTGTQAISTVTGLQTALDGKEALGLLAGVNTQTASYTLALTDIGKAVEMNVASANNLTVPPNSSVAFAVGSRIDITQIGAGQTTIVAGSGVTIRQRETKLKIAGQYGGASLYKRGTDEWVLFGDLAA